MVYKLVKQRNKTNTKWYTHWLKLPKNVLFMRAGEGKGLVLPLSFFLTPPSRKTFYKNGLWRAMGKDTVQNLLWIPLGSPPLPCMRLGSKTYQSYHLLPAKPQGKAEVVTLTSPFLFFFGYDVHIADKVRKGFGLSEGLSLHLHTPSTG